MFNITEHVQGVQYLLHCWCSNCVLYLNTCSWTRAKVQNLVFKQCSSWWKRSVLGVQTVFFPINTKVFNITEHVQGVQYLLQFWRSDGVLNLNTHFYSVQRHQASFFSFMIFASVTILHLWSLCLRVRSFCSGYRSFCYRVFLFYIQLFISWLRLVVLKRSPFVLQFKYVLWIWSFVLPKCIFYPIRRPYYSVHLFSSVYRSI